MNPMPEAETRVSYRAARLKRAIARLAELSEKLRPYEFGSTGADQGALDSHALLDDEKNRPAPSS